MLEFVLFVIAGVCVTLLLRPFGRNAELPGWLVRARARRRPGIPLTAWIAALLLMDLAWLIGERRGLLALPAIVLWLGAPLMATWISIYWLRGSRERQEVSREP